MSSLVFPLASLPGAYIDQRDPYNEVRVDEASSGKELRSKWWTYSRIRYTIKTELARSSAAFAEYQKLARFYQAHSGQFDSFLLTDPEDSSVTDCGFANGDGTSTAFQLQRSFAGGVNDRYGAWATSTKPRTNLALQSGDLSNAAWTKPAGTLAYGAAGTAPDGTATATQLICSDGTVNNIRAEQGIGNVPVNTVYTFSCFLKRGSGPYAALVYADSGSTSGDVTFNLDTGIITNQNANNVGASIVSVGGGWYRCTLTVTVTGSISGGFRVFKAQVCSTSSSPFTCAAGTYLFAWGAQVEAASAATAYIPTTASSVTVNPALWTSVGDGFEPVFDLNGAPTIYQDGDWNGRRTLRNYARTNLCTFSQAFDNAAWTKTNATLTAAATTAPDGTNTGESFNEGAVASAFHNVLSAAATTAAVTGEMRCYSAYVKAGTLPNIILQAGASNEQLQFNLSTGVINSTGGGSGTVLASGVQALANGWYRVWFTMRAGTTPPTGLYLIGADASYNQTYTGTSRIFYCWGAQIERAFDLNGPSTYIPTPSSSAVSVTDYTISSIGVVTLAAALPTGAFLSWDGSYYWRVRFDQPSLPFARIVQTMWSTGIKLISVKT